MPAGDLECLLGLKFDRLQRGRVQTRAGLDKRQFQQLAGKQIYLVDQIFRNGQPVDGQFFQPRERLVETFIERQIAVGAINEILPQQLHAFVEHFDTAHTRVDITVRHLGSLGKLFEMLPPFGQLLHQLFEVVVCFFQQQAALVAYLSKLWGEITGPHWFRRLLLKASNLSSRWI